MSTRPCPVCGRELTVIPEAEACDHGAPHASTPDELPLRIRALVMELRGVLDDMMADWVELFVLAGRAVQLAESGDQAGAVVVLGVLCDHEYELCGDRDRTGRVLTELGVDVPEGR